jgi:hypothetical protein
MVAGRVNSRLRPRLEAWLPGWDMGEDDARQILFAPILGHHGKPVSEPKKVFAELFLSFSRAGWIAGALAALRVVGGHDVGISSKLIVPRSVLMTEYWARPWSSVNP